MSGVERESAGQFRIRFAELTGGRLRRIFGSEPREVDPYAVARAVLEVMRRSDSRSPAGSRLVWNEYRVVLAPEDFDRLRALQDYLRRELQGVLEAEVARLGAELVGELCVHVVVDEAGELGAGEAVVRVAFSPSDRIAAPADHEMTVRLGERGVAGEIAAVAAPAPEATAPVEATEGGEGALVATFHVAWPEGEAALYAGVRTVAGRPHPGHPAQFIPLRGASARVSKRHIVLVAKTTRAVVGRLPGANPVHVNGAAIGAGDEIEVAEPRAEISLSRGDFVLTLSRLRAEE